jgi:hypothetical protein
VVLRNSSQTKNYFNDPRQYVRRNPTEPSSAVYESPLSMQLSSAGVLMESTGVYFGKQLPNEPATSVLTRVSQLGVGCRVVLDCDYIVTFLVPRLL